MWDTSSIWSVHLCANKGRMSSALIAMNIRFPTMSKWYHFCTLHSLHFLHAQQQFANKFLLERQFWTFKNQYHCSNFTIGRPLNCLVHYKLLHKHSNHNTTIKLTTALAELLISLDLSPKARHWPVWAWCANGFLFLDNPWRINQFTL